MSRAFAAELTERYGNLFTQDPQMKSRASAMLGRCLPPRRGPGRPGLASVSAAIRLHDELKRSFPARPAKETWQEVYRVVIPGWDNLSRIERRTEADWLWTRVRWRLYARRRKHRKRQRRS